MLLLQLFVLSSFLSIASCDSSELGAITYSKSIGGFHRPVFVLPFPGDADLMLVSDADDKSVRLISVTTGETRRVVALAGWLGSPAGVAIDSGTNSLFVGQQHGLGLTRLSMSGEVAMTVGGRGSNADDMIDSALGVAVGSGLVFVGDVTAYRVLAFDEAGHRVLTIDQTSINESFKQQSGCKPNMFRVMGSGYQGPSCFNPHGIAWTHAFGGRLFVADANNNAVLVFNKDGRHLRSIQDDALRIPRGVAVTHDGRLLVAEPRRLLLFTLSGRLLETVVIPGARNVLGVAATRDHVFAADVGSKTVHILKVEHTTDALSN